MKKLIIYSFMSIFLLAIACKKNENTRIPSIVEIPIPFIVKDKATDQIIGSQEPDKFSAKFSIGMQYPDGTKPAKYDVVIKKTSGTKTTVKTFQAGITNFPTVISITGPQLKTLFDNEVIVLGDKFDIGADITMPDGKLYQAFPAVGIPYGVNVASLNGSSTTVRYEAICKFNMADYGAIGTSVPFVVVSDGWADYSANQTVLINIIDATHFSFVYATTNNTKPIVIAVDPNTNVTSVAKVAFGDYGDGIIFTAQSSLSTSNFVGPCALTISVNLNFDSSAGGALNKVISFKKK